MVGHWWLRWQLGMDRLMHAASVVWAWLCTREGIVHVMLAVLGLVLAYLSFRFLPTRVYVAGGNGLWMGSIMLVLWLCLSTLWAHWGAMTWEAKALCLGGLLGSLGVLGRQFFWALNIWTREIGAMYADWALRWRFLPSLCVLLICAGGMIATRSFGESLYGVRGWWTRAAVVLLTTTIGSALLAL